MKRLIASAVRLVMHPLWRLSCGLTLGVRVIVTDAERRVLLIEHTYMPGWHLPGGGVEIGETAVEAAIRELAEEAAIAVTGTLDLFGLYANFNEMARDHVAVFVARDWRPLDRRPPRLEIARAAFFDLAALPEDATPGTRRRLSELFEGRERSPSW